jgi:hypothetical protein
MSPKNISGLMLIITVAWLLVLGESYFFFAVVRPLGGPIHLGFVPSTVTKIALTAGLGVMWVGVMFALDLLYTNWRRPQTPT